MLSQILVSHGSRREDVDARGVEWRLICGERDAGDFLRVEIVDKMFLQSDLIFEAVFGIHPGGHSDCGHVSIQVVEFVCDRMALIERESLIDFDDFLFGTGTGAEGPNEQVSIASDVVQAQMGVAALHLQLAVP